MRFAALLGEALVAQGFTGPGAQVRFRQYLEERYAVQVTDSAVSAWVKGVRVPGTGNLVAILDALVIPQAERPVWLQACADHPHRSAVA